jgi:hypothetical protein
MFLMISTLMELAGAHGLGCRGRAGRRGVLSEGNPIDRGRGSAAALMAKVAKNFFSIGTNDLVQYIGGGSHE